MTAQIPVDPGLAAACDRGAIADFEAGRLKKLAGGIESECGCEKGE